MYTCACINTWLERLPLQVKCCIQLRLYVRTYICTSNLHIRICVFVSIPTLYMYLHMYGWGIWGTNIYYNRVTSTATYLFMRVVDYTLSYHNKETITMYMYILYVHVPYRYRATIRFLLLIMIPFTYVRTTQRDQGPIGNTMNVTLIL